MAPVFLVLPVDLSEIYHGVRIYTIQLSLSQSRYYRIKPDCEWTRTNAHR